MLLRHVSFWCRQQSPKKKLKIPEGGTGRAVSLPNSEDQRNASGNSLPIAKGRDAGGEGRSLLTRIRRCLWKGEKDSAEAYKSLQDE